ncbi:MAG: peptide chain release factor N(5)-glutamine methyltransferase [Verrucomicrobia bacterium]|nr:MAG: peptide chain release factor N(5)-glutamine methyltransferase [Verrucomicrobiota bacterium]
MTVLEVIQRSTEFLARKGIESPRLQVEWLLAHVLGLPRLQLYLNFERRLTDAELEALRDLLRRRARHEPLQHLLGTAVFCGLEFTVNRQVLIPRPETEVLADLALQWLKSRPGQPRVLDFGTGSGCLAVTLAREHPAARVRALDVSAEALAVARENAARHGVAERIEWLEGEGWAGVPAGSRFDLIVANPPYIPTGDLAGLPPEVRDFEPRAALDGGPDGLRFYRELAAGRERVEPGGRLMAEFGDGQAEAVVGLFREAGWGEVDVAPDLAGQPRIVIATRGAS